MISLEQRLLRASKERIAAELTTLHEALGNGSPMNDADAATTGMRCAQIMGRISGLRSALQHLDQVWDEIAGNRRSNETRSKGNE